MNAQEKARKGKYRGELRHRFNIIEQWDGQRWCEPPEVGVYGGSPSKMHFDVADALHDDEDAADRAFRPR